MSENVEVRTGDSVASLVDQLAQSVTDSSLTLPIERPIPEDAWVRFALKLSDGTEVMEGVGRSRGSMPRGNPVTHYDLVLVELSFDARNEIMWERLLIAADAAEKGDDTGAIQLGEGSIEELIPGAGKAGEAPPPAPPGGPAATSSATASPSTSAAASASASTSASVAASDSAPSKPSNPPPPATAARSALASKPPPAAASKPPAAASKRPGAAASKPPPAAASKPPPSRASTHPPESAVAAAPGAHRLDVPAGLVAEARLLTSRVAPKAPGRSPEDTVLLKALRMGLAALQAEHTER